MYGSCGAGNHTSMWLCYLGVLSIPVQWTMSDGQEQFENEQLWHSRYEIQNEYRCTQTYGIATSAPMKIQRRCHECYDCVRNACIPQKGGIGWRVRAWLSHLHSLAWNTIEENKGKGVCRRQYFMRTTPGCTWTLQYTAPTQQGWMQSCCAFYCSVVSIA